MVVTLVASKSGMVVTLGHASRTLGTRAVPSPKPISQYMARTAKTAKTIELLLEYILTVAATNYNCVRVPATDYTCVRVLATLSPRG